MLSVLSSMLLMYYTPTVNLHNAVGVYGMLYVTPFLWNRPEISLMMTNMAKTILIKIHSFYSQGQKQVEK